MTPRKRMLTAFARKEPDRVPVFPWFWSILPGQVVGREPRDFDSELPMWKAQLETIRHFGCDGWVFAWLGESSQEKRYRVEEKTVESPQGVREVTTIYHTSEGRLRTRTQIPPWDNGAVLEGLVKDVDDDIEKFGEVFFDADPWTRDIGEMERMIEQTGEDAVCHGAVGTNFFEMWAGARDGGRTRAVYDLYDHSNRLRILQDKFTEYAVEQTKAILERVKVDAIFGNAAELDVLGPSLYSQWVIPTISAVSRVTRKHDVFLHVHLHGKSMEALDALIDAGVDVIDPFEKPPMGDADLREVKKRYGEKICICGNIKSVDTLLRGTREDVEHEVRGCIQAASEGGGYVLTSADEVALDTPFENIRQMVEAAHEYGQYS